MAICIKDDFAVGVQQLNAASDGFVETLVFYLEELRVVNRPPRCPYNCFESAVSQIMDQISGSMPNVIIMGNFNLSDIEWTSRTVYKGLREKREQTHPLIKSIYEDCLNQKVDVPTIGENILYLLITNNDELVNDVRILYTKQSHHEAVIVGTNIVVEESDHRVASVSGFEDLNFWTKDINWSELKRQVATM